MKEQEKVIPLVEYGLGCKNAIDPKYRVRGLVDRFYQLTKKNANLNKNLVLPPEKFPSEEKTCSPVS